MEEILRASPPEAFEPPLERTRYAVKIMIATLAASQASGAARLVSEPAPAELVGSTGLATGMAAGTSYITAMLSGVTSNAYPLTVTSSVVEPGILGSILDKSNSNGSYYVDLQLKNTGTGVASNLQLTRLTFRTLAGAGTVTYETTQSPQLPIQVPTIPAGSSATIRLFLNVPSTVSRFSINENGTVQDVAGNSFNWSSGQALFY